MSDRDELAAKNLRDRAAAAGDSDLPITVHRSAELAVARQAAREELASLGGHLLAQYGETAKLTGTIAGEDAAPLARLGGYLLEHYGSDPSE